MQESLAGKMSRQWAPWAISKAETAIMCPRQFQLKYVLKAKQEDTSESNDVGTAAHLLLELRLKGLDMKRALRAVLEKHALTAQEEEELRSFFDDIEAFLRKWNVFCKQNRVSTVFYEQKWGITEFGEACDFFAPNVFFRGAVDLGAITGEGDLVVVDHKSGYAVDLKHRDKYQTQLDAYLALALPNIKFEGGRGAIHFLRGPTDMRIQWRPYVGVEEVRSRILPALFALAEKAGSEAVEPFPAHPVKPTKKQPKPFPCGYCSYRSSCSPYQEMLRGSQS